MKSILKNDIINNIIFAIILSVTLFVFCMLIDYSNVLSFFDSSIVKILYNKEDSSWFFMLFASTLGLFPLMLLICMPSRSKKTSQKIINMGIKIAAFCLLYIAIDNTTDNKTYVNLKKERFLNSISNFYTKYSDTDEMKEILFYLDKNDYTSIKEMDIRRLEYTDSLAMTNIVNQLNNHEIKKIYDESIKDGQINLYEKQKLDTLILQQTNETI